jgi:hypothetical protein
MSVLSDLMHSAQYNGENANRRQHVAMGTAEATSTDWRYKNLVLRFVLFVVFAYSD